MFLLTHPNVGVANSMDTAVPMHLRGPSVCEETECMSPGDLAIYKHMDSVGLSLSRSIPGPATSIAPTTRATAVNAFTGDSTRPEPLFGHGPDWGYSYFGAVWYGDEIWNGGREKDYDGDGKIEEWEVLRYCDERFGGTCFKPWTKFTHPTLGEVEIGGFNPKFFSQNGPPEVLEQWAGNEAKFNLYLALSLPRVEIVDARVARRVKASVDSATHEVRVTVRNTGRLPTALEQAKKVKIVRPGPDRGRVREGQQEQAGGTAAGILARRRGNQDHRRANQGPAIGW